MFIKKDFKNIRYKRGYSLIEIMIVISIVSVIAAVVLFSYKSFDNHLATNAASQEIASTIREAQVFALSVKQNSGDFYKGYGMSFDPQDPSVYYIFVDKNNNGTYDVSNNELVESNPLRDGVKIKSVCVTNKSTNVISCNPSVVSSGTVLFYRPKPEAVIYFQNSQNFSKITITLEVGDSQSQVTVNNIGQISTQ
jgi:prepilin-type N-terminal cleavage/methylation domain-containing protein